MCIAVQQGALAIRANLISNTVGDVARTQLARSNEVSTSSWRKCCGDGESGRSGGRAVIQRLERALALAAYIVLRHGVVYAAYIDRLERELEVARRSSPIYRAKRILETYTLEGGRKAMRSSHSRLSSNDGPTP